MSPPGGLMILPWAHRLISAGAHGLRRIPGQSVNLAHPIWRTPCAPAPLQGAPPVVFRAGLWVLLAKAPSVPSGHIGVYADTPRVGKRRVPTASGCRFPVLRGFGACADAAAGGEGVFPIGSALVPILVTKNRCHPGRRSRSGTLCRKVHQGPRSALRFGGDDKRGSWRTV